MMLAIAVQSLGNLVLHAVLGRSLEPADYGALGSVLAAMTLVAVPLTALQTSAARTAATAGLSGRTGRGVLVDSARNLLLLGALTLALAGPIAGFLHLGSWWDAALLAPTLVIAGLLATARGLLLGVGRSALVASAPSTTTEILRSEEPWAMARTLTPAWPSDPNSFAAVRSTRADFSPCPARMFTASSSTAAMISPPAEKIRLPKRRVGKKYEGIEYPFKFVPENY